MSCGNQDLLPLDSFQSPIGIVVKVGKKDKKMMESPLKVEGRAWVIKKDNIDTDMIFHNRYLSITDINEMGRYTFDNLKGYEDFSKKVKKGENNGKNWFRNHGKTKGFWKSR